MPRFPPSGYSSKKGVGHENLKTRSRAAKFAPKFAPSMLLVYSTSFHAGRCSETDKSAKLVWSDCGGSVIFGAPRPKGGSAGNIRAKEGIMRKWLWIASV